MRYMVAEQKVVERGTLDGKRAIIEYAPAPHYGIHDSVTAAKRAYVVANDSDWAGCADERVAQQFDAWRRNGFLGGAKILKLQGEVQG